MKLNLIGLTLVLLLFPACSDTSSEQATTDAPEASIPVAETAVTANPLPTGVWRIDSISDSTGETIPPAFNEETYGTRIIIWTDGDQMAADFCGSFGPSLILADRGGYFVGNINPDAPSTMEGCMEQVSAPGASFTALDETTISVDVFDTNVVLRLTDEDCPQLLTGNC